MSEKLTVAELLARNAREGGRNASDRPRRRRNLDDGGVSVSELTGSIPVVKIDDEDGQGEAAEGAGNTADAQSVVAGATGTSEGAVAERHGGHEADDPEEAEAPEASGASGASGASESHEGFDEQSTIVQAVVPDSLLTSANPSGEFVAVDAEDAEAVNGDAAEEDTADAADAADTADADDTVDADADVVEGEVVDDDTDATDTDATDIDDAADADEVDAPDEADDLAVVASAGAGATAGAGDLAASSLAEPEADRASAAVPAEAPAAAASKKTRAPKDDEIVEYEDDTVSWPAVVAQSAAAVILGVLIFFGFTLLWDNLGTVLVLVMALVVTCVCVGVVHSLLRHRDTLLLVLTFVVGIALTVGPRLIMSI